ncbi:AP2 domain-containing protein [Secundilactobacillus collinoides]|uniref:AP2 domain-containing protein n=1 Tax=Secundilactobacillus collinoides TaxID=33960 RepID=UPI0009E6A1E1|nr:AP2 domain-containing protein [Secundilactobacillus collinoides]
MSQRMIDMSGHRIGRLVVIKRAGKLSNGNITWFCQCDCGNQCVVDGHLLRTGRTLSCGCIRKQRSRELIRNNPKTRQYIGNWKPLEKTWHPRATDRRKNNSSGITGVSYDQKQHRWIARLYFKGRYVLNKTFDNKANAVEARRQAELRFLTLQEKNEQL